MVHLHVPVLFFQPLTSVHMYIYTYVCIACMLIIVKSFVSSNFGQSTKCKYICVPAHNPRTIHLRRGMLLH